MIFKTDTGELVMLFSQGKGPKLYHNIVCLGNRRHYRKDGTCRHTEALLGLMRPWHRARATVTPWGSSHDA